MLNAFFLHMTSIAEHDKEFYSALSEKTADFRKVEKKISVQLYKFS